MLPRLAVLAAGAFLLQDAEATDSSDDVICPAPPSVSSHNPAKRTALASHPRAGSTWSRFLIERATGLPSGSEKPPWANVLPHFGGEANPKMPNREGVITKTHSSCYGCWPSADVQKERFTITRNSSKFTKKQMAKHAGKEYVKELESKGACLFFPPYDFNKHLGALSQMQGPAEALRKKQMTQMDDTPCNYEYDKAIILIRDPLDAIKSNYHYRTAVLGMRPQGTWAQDDYDFPFERGESFVKFYDSWNRFAEFNPTITVKYEDLKSDTKRELRRIVDFLELEVSDETLECAIRASTVDKLKETKMVGVGPGGVKPDMFFGSRDQTTGKEAMLYPESLLTRFEKVGLSEMRELYGYGPLLGKPTKGEL